MLSAPFTESRAISRLVVGRAWDGLDARVEVRLIDARGLAVLDAPTGETDAERALVREDLVGPFVPRPDGDQHAPRHVRLVDRQRDVRHEIRERVRDAVEQRVEALLSEHVVEDVGEPPIRLDERVRRPLLSVRKQAQWECVIAHRPSSIR
jgi:hypothetical protein